MIKNTNAGIKNTPISLLQLRGKNCRGVTAQKKQQVCRPPHNVHTVHKYQKLPLKSLQYGPPQRRPAAQGESSDSSCEHCDPAALQLCPGRPEWSMESPTARGGGGEKKKEEKKKLKYSDLNNLLKIGWFFLIICGSAHNNKNIIHTQVLHWSNQLFTALPTLQCLSCCTFTGFHGFH